MATTSPRALPSATSASPNALRVASFVPGSYDGRVSGAGREPMRLARDLRLRNVDMDVPDPTELLDRRIRVVERLAVLAELVGHGLHAVALLGAGDHDGRLSGGLDGASA